MIVDAPWYVPNTVMRRDLQTSIVNEEIRRYSNQYTALLRAYPNYLIAARQQTIAKTPAKWSAYYISSAIVVFVIVVFKL
jgi:hypothetical protein